MKIKKINPSYCRKLENPKTDNPPQMMRYPAPHDNFYAVGVASAMQHCFDEDVICYISGSDTKQEHRFWTGEGSLFISRVSNLRNTRYIKLLKEEGVLIGDIIPEYRDELVEQKIPECQ